MSAWASGPPRSAYATADLSALAEAGAVGATLKLKTMLGEDVAGEVRVASAPSEQAAKP